MNQGRSGEAASTITSSFGGAHMTGIGGAGAASSFQHHQHRIHSGQRPANENVHSQNQAATMMSGLAHMSGNAPGQAASSSAPSCPERPSLFALLDLLSSEQYTTSEQRMAMRTILRDYLVNKVTHDQVWSYLGRVIGFQMLADCIKYLAATNQKAHAAGQVKPHSKVSASSLARIDAAFGIHQFASPNFFGKMPDGSSSQGVEKRAAPAGSGITAQTSGGETDPASSLSAKKDASESLSAIADPVEDIGDLEELFGGAEWTNHLPHFKVPRVAHGQASVMLRNKLFLLGGLGGEHDRDRASFKNLVVINLWDFQAKEIGTYGNPPPALAAHTASLVNFQPLRGDAPPDTTSASTTADAPTLAADNKHSQEEEDEDDDRESGGERERSQVLVFGGRTAGGQASDELYSFDIESARWVRLEVAGAARPAARWGHCAAVWPPRSSHTSVNGGGNRRSREGTELQFETEFLLIWGGVTRQNSYQQGKATEEGLRRCRRSPISGDDKVLLNDMWAFHLKTNTWIELKMAGAELPLAREGSTLFWKRDEDSCFGIYGGETWRRPPSSSSEETQVPSAESAEHRVILSDVWNCRIKVSPPSTSSSMSSSTSASSASNDGTAANGVASDDNAEMSSPPTAAAESDEQAATVADSSAKQSSQSCHQLKSKSHRSSAVIIPKIEAEWTIDSSASRNAVPRAHHRSFLLSLRVPKSSKSTSVLLTIGGATQAPPDPTQKINFDVRAEEGESVHTAAYMSTLSAVEECVYAKGSISDAIDIVLCHLPPSKPKVQRHIPSSVSVTTNDDAPTDDTAGSIHSSDLIYSRPAVWKRMIPPRSSSMAGGSFKGRCGAASAFFHAFSRPGRESPIPCVLVGTGRSHDELRMVRDYWLLSLTGEDPYDGVIIGPYQKLLAASNAGMGRHMRIGDVEVEGVPSSLNESVDAAADGGDSRVCESFSDARLQRVKRRRLNGEDKTDVMVGRGGTSAGIPAATVLRDGESVSGVTESAGGVQQASKGPSWASRPSYTPGVFWPLVSATKWAFSALGHIIENSLKPEVGADRIAITTLASIYEFGSSDANENVEGSSQSSSSSIGGLSIQDNGCGIDYVSMHKLLKKVGHFNPGEQNSPTDTYGVGFKAALGRLGSSCMVISRTSSVVGAGLLSQKLLAHIDSQSLCAPVCMWRIHTREMITSGFPCSDVRHSQRLLMAYSPLSSPSKIAAEMARLNGEPGTRMLFWGLRDDLSHLSFEKSETSSSIIVLSDAPPPRDKDNWESKAEGESGVGGTNASTKLPPDFPLWKSARYAIDYCLPTYLFWSYLHNAATILLNGTPIVPSDSKPLGSWSAPIVSSAEPVLVDPPEDRYRNSLYRYLQDRLYQAAELQYLRRPSESEHGVYGLVGFLNDPNSPVSDASRVCETGILLYRRGKLIRRLVSPFPARREVVEHSLDHFDDDKQKVSKSDTTDLKERKALLAKKLKTAALDDWRMRISGFINVPDWMIPDAGKEEFLHHGCAAWRDFEEMVEDVLIEYLNVCGNPEEFKSWQASRQARYAAYTTSTAALVGSAGDLEVAAGAAVAEQHGSGAAAAPGHEDGRLVDREMRDGDTGE